MNWNYILCFMAGMIAGPGIIVLSVVLDALLHREKWDLS